MSESNHAPVREDFLDFPTAWRILRESPDLEHHLRCSYEQTDGALLCDCGAVEREWERRRDEQQGAGPDSLRCECGSARISPEVAVVSGRKRIVMTCETCHTSWMTTEPNAGEIILAELSPIGKRWKQ